MVSRFFPFPPFSFSSRRAQAAGLWPLLWLLVFLFAGPEGNAAPPPAGLVDRDGDGVEDLLQSFVAGEVDWAALRTAARSSRQASPPASRGGDDPPFDPGPGPWARGNLRLLCWGETGAGLALARERAQAAGGVCRLLHEVPRLGQLAVLEVDPAGLREVLALGPGRCRVMLDREGRPALQESRALVGAELVAADPWRVQGDWTSTVAILDSGCDTAHDDLGDPSRDNIDGPPPAVGHALDWYSAELGWPVFPEYKVVGWQDVTDDFPGAVGPWDYHHHGTALAGVVAGAGEIDPALRGVASETRLTIVKFYDFDTVWHQWAGDFLAACAWVLDNRDTFRIRVALIAVNWEVDAGISQAMSDLLAAGILPVVAVGNEGDDGLPPGYPARLSQVLTVGSVNDAGAVAAFSRRGQLGLEKPDLVAPGGGLLPADGRITTTDNEPNDTYSGRYGTSLAAAHVAAGASLLLEAMQQEGIPAPASGPAADLVKILLKGTAAYVGTAETPDGSGTITLSPSCSPDSVRGWGLLQIQGAMEAALQPVPIGGAVTDSLGGQNGRRVLGRRLTVLPGGRCRVEVVPAPDLDVVLEIHNTRWLQEPEWGQAPLRIDSGGPGAAEGGLFQASPAGLFFVVVKLRSGQGMITLSVDQAPGEEGSAFRAVLGGPVSGWPNCGQLAGTEGPSVVLTSYFSVDPLARQVHAFTATGQQRPGWPVFLFLPSTLSGPLSGPLVWDLDGQAGDEVVVASDFGRVYYLGGDGSVVTREIAPPNVALTAPVGIQQQSGQREVVLADEAGTCYRLSATGTLLDSFPLGGTQPRSPAVGSLRETGQEEIVVALASGQLVVLDAAGTTLPGWPVALGDGSPGAPVLADVDADGLHDVIVLMHEPPPAGLVTARVFGGDGLPKAPDGTVLPAPGAGGWEILADPAVARIDASSLRITTWGLVRSGTGEDAEFSLAAASLASGGGVDVQPVTGFRVQASNPSGYLRVRWAKLPPPLVWDFASGDGAEARFLASVGWEEVIPSVPDLQGATAAWYDAGGGLDLVTWQGLSQSGHLFDAGAPVAAALCPVGADGLFLVSCLDDVVTTLPLRPLPGEAGCWAAARADGRNSGVLPLGGGPATDLAGLDWPAPGLRLWPNPAAGDLRVHWQGVRRGPAELEIYDLRGRRLRCLRIENPVAREGILWNGCDGRGRAVAAGTYLFRLIHPEGTLSGRAVLAR